jgi:ParB family transcriptional regulator, chromosome partitioning protein
MTDITSIPLNKLVASEDNVRKTAGADTALHELASSIAAHGLLQSLVVRKRKKGKFAVVAGGRRLAALLLLADAGKIDPAYGVPCKVLGSDADAVEISLAENSVREAMHPADEFEAFRSLVDGGMSEADVAARFGVTEAVVSRRLRLARVSPMIVAAYRRNELSLDLVMAFAVSDDHAAQERVFLNLAGWNRKPEHIRDVLTENEIAATDRRVQFVTLPAYEGADGAVRRDLFCDDDSGIFILDPVLLDRLVTEKLEAEAEAVRAEGWKWIAVRPSFEYDEWSEYGRQHAESVPLQPEAEAELNLLTLEHEKLCEIDHADEEALARMTAIEQRIGELETEETYYPPETLAMAGAVVYLDHHGDLGVRRGFIAPDDAPAEADAESSDADGEAPEAEDAAEAVSSLPHSLIESLTTHRTAAIAVALSQQHTVALAAVVHALALRAFYGSSGDSCLEMFSKHVSLKLAEGSKARALLETGSEMWREHLPGNAEDLFAWCLAQSQDRLLDLLAFCAGLSVNAVQAKADRPDSDRLLHAQALGEALSLDMTAWFTPTAGNYFGRLTKDGIVDSLRDARNGAVAPAWLKAKKADLAVIAEREVADTGWLPAPLRRAA